MMAGTKRLPKPYYSSKGITLYHGEALTILSQLREGSFRAVTTDPPYSSGGRTSAERTRSPLKKYVQSGQNLKRPDFAGENRDQRSFGWWSFLWLSQCLRLAEPSGYLLVFSDWRQFPTTSDAVQAGGWTWRGVVPWDKGLGARAPHKGFFRHQCEYVLWATRGAVPRPSPGEAGPFPGCVREPVRQSDKHHMVGKPTEVMIELLRCCNGRGRVLDPFAGAGTTLVAAKRLGLKAVGIDGKRSTARLRQCAWTRPRPDAQAEERIPDLRRKHGFRFQCLSGHSALRPPAVALLRRPEVPREVSMPKRPFSVATGWSSDDNLTSWVVEQVSMPKRPFSVATLGRPWVNLG